MDPSHQDIARDGTKPEHIHLFASRAKAHTYVIVLRRTASRDVWVVVRCAVAGCGVGGGGGTAEGGEYRAQPTTSVRRVV